MNASSRHAADQRRSIWPPEPGAFAMRLVKNGWRVPARIHHQDDGRWAAEVDEEMCEPHLDPALAPMVAALWHGGIKIDEQTYRWLLAMKAHAIEHDPSHPALNPRKAIDPRLLKPLT